MVIETQSQFFINFLFLGFWFEGLQSDLIMNALNYAVVNGMCCCLNICCKELWETLHKIVGKMAFVKFAYCLVYFGSVAISILLISLISDWSWFMDYLAPGIQCNQDDFLGCLSSSVVYRVSTCLLIFTMLMFCIMLVCPTRAALILNEGLFFSKFVIVVIFTAISFQLDNSYFLWFGSISQIFSYAFVMLQSIILIDLAYLWGIKWAGKYSNGSRKYAYFLIIVTSFMFLAGLYLLINRFNQPNHEELGWSDTMCVIQILIMIGVQLLNFNKQNSLLTTSALCLLVIYSNWAAGSSHPSAQIDETVLYFNMAISFLLLLVSTAGSIYGSSNKEDEESNFIDLDDINERGNDREEARERERKVWIQWHIYLAGMSMYIGMIVTDWGSADIAKKKFNLTTEAWTSKLVMGYVVFVMYTWSLLAPRICPHRNFYFQ